MENNILSHEGFQLLGIIPNSEDFDECYNLLESNINTDHTVIGYDLNYKNMNGFNIVTFFYNYPELTLNVNYLKNKDIPNSKNNSLYFSGFKKDISQFICFNDIYHKIYILDEQNRDVNECLIKSIHTAYNTGHYKKLCCKIDDLFGTGELFSRITIWGKLLATNFTDPILLLNHPNIYGGLVETIYHNFFLNVVHGDAMKYRLSDYNPSGNATIEQGWNEQHDNYIDIFLSGYDQIVRDTIKGILIQSMKDKELYQVLYNLENNNVDVDLYHDLSDFNNTRFLNDSCVDYLSYLLKVRIIILSIENDKNITIPGVSIFGHAYDETIFIRNKSGHYTLMHMPTLRLYGKITINTVMNQFNVFVDNTGSESLHSSVFNDRDNKDLFISGSVLKMPNSRLDHLYLNIKYLFNTMKNMNQSNIGQGKNLRHFFIPNSFPQIMTAVIDMPIEHDHSLMKFSEIKSSNKSQLLNTYKDFWINIFYSNSFIFMKSDIVDIDENTSSKNELIPDMNQSFMNHKISLNDIDEDYKLDDYTDKFVDQTVIYNGLYSEGEYYYEGEIFMDYEGMCYMCDETESGSVHEGEDGRIIENHEEFDYQEGEYFTDYEGENLIWGSECDELILNTDIFDLSLDKIYDAEQAEQVVIDEINQKNISEYNMDVNKSKSFGSNNEKAITINDKQITIPEDYTDHKTKDNAEKQQVQDQDAKKDDGTITLINKNLLDQSLSKKEEEKEHEMDKKNVRTVKRVEDKLNKDFTSGKRLMYIDNNNTIVINFETKYDDNDIVELGSDIPKLFEIYRNFNCSIISRQELKDMVYDALGNETRDRLESEAMNMLMSCEYTPSFNRVEEIPFLLEALIIKFVGMMNTESGDDLKHVMRKNLFKHRHELFGYIVQLFFSNDPIYHTDSRIEGTKLTPDLDIIINKNRYFIDFSVVTKIENLDTSKGFGGNSKYYQIGQDNNAIVKYIPFVINDDDNHRIYAEINDIMLINDDIPRLLLNKFREVIKKYVFAMTTLMSMEKVNDMSKLGIKRSTIFDCDYKYTHNQKIPTNISPDLFNMVTENKERFLQSCKQHMLNKSYNTFSNYCSFFLKNEQMIRSKTYMDLHLSGGSLPILLAIKYYLENINNFFDSPEDRKPSRFKIHGVIDESLLIKYMIRTQNLLNAELDDTKKDFRSDQYKYPDGSMMSDEKNVRFIARMVKYYNDNKLTFDDSEILYFCSDDFFDMHFMYSAFSKTMNNTNTNEFTTSYISGFTNDKNKKKNQKIGNYNMPVRQLQTIRLNSDRLHRESNQNINYSYDMVLFGMSWDLYIRQSESRRVQHREDQRKKMSKTSNIMEVNELRFSVTEKIKIFSQCLISSIAKLLSENHDTLKCSRTNNYYSLHNSDIQEYIESRWSFDNNFKNWYNVSMDEITKTRFLNFTRNSDLFEYNIPKKDSKCMIVMHGGVPAIILEEDNKKIPKSKTSWSFKQLYYNVKYDNKSIALYVVANDMSKLNKNGIQIYVDGFIYNHINNKSYPTKLKLSHNSKIDEIDVDRIINNEKGVKLPYINDDNKVSESMMKSVNENTIKKHDLLNEKVTQKAKKSFALPFPDMELMKITGEGGLKETIEFFKGKIDDQYFQSYLIETATIRGIDDKGSIFDVNEQGIADEMTRTDAELKVATKCLLDEIYKVFTSKRFNQYQMIQVVRKMLNSDNNPLLNDIRSHMNIYDIKFKLHLKSIKNFKRLQFDNKTGNIQVKQLAGKRSSDKVVKELKQKRREKINSWSTEISKLRLDSKKLMMERNANNSNTSNLIVSDKSIDEKIKTNKLKIDQIIRVKSLFLNKQNKEIRNRKLKLKKYTMDFFKRSKVDENIMKNLKQSLVTGMSGDIVQNISKLKSIMKFNDMKDNKAEESTTADSECILDDNDEKDEIKDEIDQFNGYDEYEYDADGTNNQESIISPAIRLLLDHSYGHFKNVGGKNITEGYGSQHLDIEDYNKKLLQLFKNLLSKSVNSVRGLDLDLEIDYEGNEMLSSMNSDLVNEGTFNILRNSVMSGLLNLQQEMCKSLSTSSIHSAEQHRFKFENFGFKNFLMIIRYGKSAVKTSHTVDYSVIYPINDLIEEVDFGPGTGSHTFYMINGIKYVFLPWRKHHIDLINYLSIVGFGTIINLRLSSYRTILENNYTMEQVKNESFLKDVICDHMLAFYLPQNSKRSVETFLHNMRFILTGSFSKYLAANEMMPKLITSDSSIFHAYIQRSVIKNHVSLYNQLQPLALSPDLRSYIESNVLKNPMTGRIVRCKISFTEIFYSSYSMTKGYYTKSIEQHKNLVDVLKNLKSLGICKDMDLASYDLKGDIYDNARVTETLTYSGDANQLAGMLLTGDLLKSTSKGQLDAVLNDILNKQADKMANNNGLRGDQSHGDMFNQKGYSVVYRRMKEVSKKRELEITNNDKMMEEAKRLKFEEKSLDLEDKWGLRFNDNIKDVLLVDEDVKKKINDGIINDIMGNGKKDVEMYIRYLKEYKETLNNIDMRDETTRALHSYTVYEALVDNPFITPVLHQVEKKQRAGSREIYVIDYVTKLWQQVLEGFNQHLATMIDEEVISVPGSQRSFYIHNKFHDIKDVKSFKHVAIATLDATKWAQASMTRKYADFYKGMRNVLPDSFLDFVFHFLEIYEKKVVLTREYVVKILKGRATNMEDVESVELLNMLREAPEYSDDAFAFYMPNSFMMGIMNFLSSLHHVAFQKLANYLMINNSEKNNCLTFSNAIGHSDDSNARIYSISEEMIPKYLYLYEYVMLLGNILLSKKKSIIDIVDKEKNVGFHFQEFLSIFYIKGELLPMVSKFVSQLTFDATDMGFHADQSYAVNKCVELNSNGGTYEECYFTLLMCSKITAYKYQINKYIDFSNHVVEFGPLKQHPLMYIISGTSCEMFDLIDTADIRMYEDFYKNVNVRLDPNSMSFSPSWNHKFKLNNEMVNLRNEFTHPELDDTLEFLLSNAKPNFALLNVLWYGLKLKNPSFTKATQNENPLFKLLRVQGALRTGSLSCNGEDVGIFEYVERLKVYKIKWTKEEEEGLHKGRKYIWSNLLRLNFQTQIQIHYELKKLKMCNRSHSRLTCKPIEIDLIKERNMYRPSVNASQLVVYIKYPQHYYNYYTKNLERHKEELVNYLSNHGVSLDDLSPNFLLGLIQDVTKYTQKRNYVYSYTQTNNRNIKNYNDLINLLKTNTTYSTSYNLDYIPFDLELNEFDMVKTMPQELLKLNLVNAYALSIGLEKGNFDVKMDNKQYDENEIRDYNNNCGVINPYEVNNIDQFHNYSYWSIEQLRDESGYIGVGDVIIKLGHLILRIQLEGPKIKSVIYYSFFDSYDNYVFDRKTTDFFNKSLNQPFGVTTISISEIPKSTTNKNYLGYKDGFVLISNIENLDKLICPALQIFELPDNTSLNVVYNFKNFRFYVDVIGIMKPENGMNHNLDKMKKMRTDYDNCVPKGFSIGSCILIKDMKRINYKTQLKIHDQIQVNNSISTRSEDDILNSFKLSVLGDTIFQMLKLKRNMAQNKLLITARLTGIETIDTILNYNDYLSKNNRIDQSQQFMSSDEMMSAIRGMGVTRVPHIIKVIFNNSASSLKDRNKFWIYYKRLREDGDICSFVNYMNSKDEKFSLKDTLSILLSNFDGIYKINTYQMAINNVDYIFQYIEQYVDTHNNFFNRLLDVNNIFRSNDPQYQKNIRNYKDTFFMLMNSLIEGFSKLNVMTPNYCFFSLLDDIRIMEEKIKLNDIYRRYKDYYTGIDFPEDDKMGLKSIELIAMNLRFGLNTKRLYIMKSLGLKSLTADQIRNMNSLFAKCIPLMGMGSYNRKKILETNKEPNSDFIKVMKSKSTGKCTHVVFEPINTENFLKNCGIDLNELSNQEESDSYIYVRHSKDQKLKLDNFSGRKFYLKDNKIGYDFLKDKLIKRNNSNMSYDNEMIWHFHSQFTKIKSKLDGSNSSRINEIDNLMGLVGKLDGANSFITDIRTGNKDSACVVLDTNHDYLEIVDNSNIEKLIMSENREKLRSKIKMPDDYVSHVIVNSAGNIKKDVLKKGSLELDLDKTKKVEEEGFIMRLPIINTGQSSTLFEDDSIREFLFPNSLLEVEVLPTQYQSFQNDKLSYVIPPRSFNENKIYKFLGSQSAKQYLISCGFKLLDDVDDTRLKLEIGNSGDEIKMSMYISEFDDNEESYKQVCVNEYKKEELFSKFKENAFKSHAENRDKMEEDNKMLAIEVKGILEEKKIGHIHQLNIFDPINELKYPLLAKYQIEKIKSSVDVDNLKKADLSADQMKEVNKILMFKKAIVEKKKKDMNNIEMPEIDFECEYEGQNMVRSIDYMSDMNRLFGMNASKILSLGYKLNPEKKLALIQSINLAEKMYQSYIENFKLGYENGLYELSQFIVIDGRLFSKHNSQEYLFNQINEDVIINSTTTCGVAFMNMKLTIEMLKSFINDMPVTQNVSNEGYDLMGIVNNLLDKQSDQLSVKIREGRKTTVKRNDKVTASIDEIDFFNDTNQDDMNKSDYKILK